MQVTTGTVTGTGNLTLTSGSLTGNGTLSLGAGTTTIARTNTLGGTTAWTFYNLQLGNGTNAGTTTPSFTATTTVGGRLTIAAAHVLDGNGIDLDPRCLRGRPGARDGEARVFGTIAGNVDDLASAIRHGGELRQGEADRLSHRRV